MVGRKSKLLTIKHDLMAIRPKPAKIGATNSQPHSYIKRKPCSHCKSNYAYDAWAAERKFAAMDASTGKKYESKPI